MKMYQANDDENFVDSILQGLEQDTGKKIFTMRILEHTVEGLDTIVVFEDKTMMMGIIKVGTIYGKISIRMQGNYV